MGVKFANNAYGTLNASITSTDASLTLSSGQGARFPSLGAGDYFYVTLIDTSNNLEIAKCTARSSDVLTITRAQEGTIARAFAVGDRVELRVTAAAINAVADEARLQSDTAPTLAGNLNTNGYNITGDGTITLTLDTGEVFQFFGRAGTGVGSGIDIVPVHATNTSPFIRFYDSADNSATNSIVDDNNWAIGADDSGVSSFKIIYGGPAGSTKITGITGVAAALEISSGELTYFDPAVSYYGSGTYAGFVGGTTQTTLWSATVTKGTYLVHVHMNLLADGSASDVDQTVIELRRNGSAVSGGYADIARQDSGQSGQGTTTSGYTGLDDSGSFTAVVNCSGSDTLSTVAYTTDPGDAGGAGYQARVTVFKLGR